MTLAAVTPGRFVNIAHRGASGHAPENTRIAIERAVSMGADWIEIDVRRTRDGVLVAFHDDSLERTTNGTGPFAGRSLAELRRLDAGGWFNRERPARADAAFAGIRIATLAELIEALGSAAGLYIEAKAAADQPGIESDLVELLRGYGLIESGRVVLQAFATGSVEQYATLAPEVPRVQLLEYAVDADGHRHELHGVTPPADQLGPADFAALAGRAHGIGPNLRDAAGRPVLDRAFIDGAHAAGLFVHVYTVDDPDTMRTLIDWGVDGIFTNFPDRLAQLRPRVSP